MQKELLDILREKDFISFEYKDWATAKDGDFTGHRYNKDPISLNLHCSFLGFTPDYFRGIPYKYNDFYQKYFIDGKKRLFKKDNAYITKVQRYSKKLNRWVIIWQSKN